jgi:predicted Zn-dependent peptidase
MFAVLVPASGQDPEKVEQAAYKVIEEAMTTKPFTAEELDGYKVRVRAAKIGAVDGNSSLAGELAQSQNLYGDWHQFFREQERVQELSVKDLLDVLKTSVKKSNRTVGLIQNPAAAAANEGGH